MGNKVFLLVGLQVITITVLTLFVWLFLGVQTALSMVLGGLSYILPTLIAVLILKFLRPYPVLAGSAFIAAEILKIVLALIFMVSVFCLYPSMQFIPYFIGLLAVSHLVFLFFLKVHRYGK
ncbi:ATP synthase subunit I [Kingella kingae]|uniref:ATP synthase subunit I n=2 Tax=Kingella kingae TaxID=504 RepID=UPI0009B7D8BE|nr:ATP synthase subunit I [Kingella kingae]MDK4575939.1 ATP synthase subunit I [Kingella kingae]MDK4581783.1 ATP synthase subunit I [Kingella kingae]MDK4594160.1 ATP synthase subunit I [Kingella kingae]MDK4645961.1 ATP synthase subunit I [Kingella kingae]MDK4675711.1 ATP synthase subunit I [Kingella kingae]